MGLCEYLDIGITRHWIESAIDWITDWCARWYASSPRSTVFKSTFTKSEVCAFYQFYGYDWIKQSTCFFFVLCCRRSESPHLVRTPSPRRRNHLHPPHDVGFSDTVSNVVEIVKEEKGNHRGYRPNGRYPRGTRLTHICCKIFFFIF